MNFSLHTLSTHASMHTVQMCVLTLHACNYRSSMEEEVPFEAEHVLQELYNLDAVVQGVQAGTWERYISLPPLLSPAVSFTWHCCTHPHNHS